MTSVAPDCGDGAALGVPLIAATNVARKVIYPGFLAVTFHELESIMIPSGR